MAPKFPDENERKVEHADDERDLDRIVAHHQHLAAAELSLQRVIEEAGRELEIERGEQKADP